MTYDVLVAGGGLTGAALACALASTQWRIGVLEPGARADRRAIALSASSERIFRALGLWKAMEAHATPIHVVHVSQQGRFGVTRLRASELGVSALGQVVLHEHLLDALHQRLQAAPRISLLHGMRAEALEQDASGATLQATGPDGPRRLRARLVVAADGAQSALRTALGIAAEVTDYGQNALVCEITTGRSPGGVAYERFTTDGPLALLPLGERRCALVWSLREQKARTMAQWPAQRFATTLQQAFGHRLGRLRPVGGVRLFPLRMLRAQRNFEGRVVLLGNAAHALHPVAAQGFNLALRETALLAELLHAQWRGGHPPGAEGVLARFAESVAGDVARTVRFTDTLARLFTTPGLGHLRGGLLAGLDLLPPLKHRLARLGMGLHGPVPRLVAGIPLEEDGRCTLTW